MADIFLLSTIVPGDAVDGNLDLRAADVDFLTIGQYLQPTVKHHQIDRFVTPDEFDAYKSAAYGKGFLMVSSSPLTRSSYHADSDFAEMRAAREAKPAAL